jgi:hypothetical protein
MASNRFGVFRSHRELQNQVRMCGAGGAAVTHPVVEELPRHAPV